VGNSGWKHPKEVKKGIGRVGYSDYTGSKEVTVDSKHRVNIPAQFRKVLAENSVTEVVISKGFDSDHIDVYPLPKWIKISEKVAASMQLANRTHRNFLRRFTQNAARCALDSQGRIMLTPDLMSICGIEDGSTVKVIGVMDFMEIWNPQTLKDHEENTPLTEKDYEKLEDLPLI
jgi:MraZ protein